jgi:hypothetical protein
MIRNGNIPSVPAHPCGLHAKRILIPPDLKINPLRIRKRLILS